MSNLSVQVVPRASRSEVVSFSEGVLKVRIAAPPVDGAANRELKKFLAGLFNVPKSSIVILAGEASRRKVVAVKGLDDSAMRTFLGSYV